MCIRNGNKGSSTRIAARGKCEPGHRGAYRNLGRVQLRKQHPTTRKRGGQRLAASRYSIRAGVDLYTP